MISVTEPKKYRKLILEKIIFAFPLIVIRIIGQSHHTAYANVIPGYPKSDIIGGVGVCLVVVRFFHGVLVFAITGIVNKVDSCDCLCCCYFQERPGPAPRYISWI
jgi:hypothetical protein